MAKIIEELREENGELNGFVLIETDDKRRAVVKKVDFEKKK